MKQLIDLFFPPRCTFCRKLIPSTLPIHVCSDCFEEISLINGKACKICGVKIPDDAVYDICGSCQKEKHRFVKNYVPFIYKGKVRDAIHRLKYNEKKSHAQTFAKFMEERIVSDWRNLKFDYICFVPSHKITARKRGYVQTELIAKCLAKSLSCPLIPALVKIINSPPQVGLSSNQRKKNVLGVFKANPKFDLSQKTILLVDDTFTTGATLNECTKVLKRAGAQNVYTTTVAITSL